MLFLIRQLIIINFINVFVKTIDCSSVSSSPLVKFENNDMHTNLVTYQSAINDWLTDVDLDFLNFNRLTSNITWQRTVQLKNDEHSDGLIERIVQLKIAWINDVCNTATNFHTNWLLEDQQRKIYLLCRGPNFTENELSYISKLQSTMFKIYTTTEICLTENQQCYHIEPELENIMSSENSTEQLLRTAWTLWHNTVGTQIKQYYPIFVQFLNTGAQRQLYHDIGETWREELEINDLENVVLQLYREIEPLYMDLHAVVRYVLNKKYGSEIVDPNGLIPAHLLGNMWAQDWTSLIPLLIGEQFNLENVLKSKNWTVIDMVIRAEDFYTSMGFPPMTRKFWKYSQFQKDYKSNTTCHGTAANMFTGDDFRVIMCLELSLYDFYVIHHEMGHIQYYMAYSDQPVIFQDGANSAFQESIGDTIMLGAMSPFHLHRLGLITDQQLNDKDFNMALLLYQALLKIPHIPYAMLLDQYRWNIFSNRIKFDDWNRVFWQMNANLRGIKPPQERTENYFDAGAKFHVADNTPYIRYFLSYILQFQIFKGMCNVEIFGKHMNNINYASFADQKFLLNRCDIYGSKTAGKKLRNFLSYGGSKHWRQIFPVLTGNNQLSTEPLLEYFSVIHKWLKKQIIINNIPVGW